MTLPPRHRLLFLSGLLLAAAPLWSATTYYVDAVGGNDANPGTSAGAAWKTLGKVNGRTFAAGDRMLFKRGATWQGYVRIRSPGTAANPIYFGAYGDAALAKPRIDAGGVVYNPTQTIDKQFSAAIYIDNSASHITVEGFAVTNFDGHDLVDGAEGNRSGIKISHAGSQSDIRILNNEIFAVEGFSNHPTVGKARGTTLDQAIFNQYFSGALYCNADQMSGLVIDGNAVHDCTGTGIFGHFYTQGTGVVVQNNSVRNIGSDGIVFQNTTSLLVQRNSCINAGLCSPTATRRAGDLGCNGLAVAGMWALASKDFTFQFNYCEGTRQITYDGQPWDFDIVNTGTCVYQYNLSRDNEGGFILANNETTAGYQRICRYNISINDGAKQGRGEGFFNGTRDLYHNVFYRTDGKPFTQVNSKGIFADNVFITNATAGNTYQGSGTTFSNNCFYGHTALNPGTGAVLKDPLFSDPASALSAHGIDAVAGFQLQAGSPLVNQGVVNAASGTRDFWGNPLSDGRPDIGAAEWTAHPPRITVPAVVAPQTLVIHP